MATSPQFTKTVGSQCTRISDTTLTTILTADATYARRITGIVVTTDDTSAQTATLYLNDGGAVDFPMGAVSVAIGAGTVVGTLAAGLIAIFTTVFRDRDATGLTIYNIPIGYSIKLKMAAVTGGKYFYVVVKYEKYD